MDRTEFLDIVQTALARWPFSDKEEFMRTRWMRVLWQEAQRWDAAQAEAFALAVEKRIGDPKQFGRPSSESIVKAVWALTGTAPVPSTDMRYSKLDSAVPHKYEGSPLQEYIDSRPPPKEREPACDIEKERLAAIAEWEANRPARKQPRGLP